MTVKALILSFMIHVYLVPGMAANPSIFDHIKLPADCFSLHPLTWKIPDVDESMSSYAKRMLKEVKHDNPVLVGVSFGGVVVQEMAKYVKYKKLIIISSVKTKTELPRRMLFSKALGLYRIAPVGLVKHVNLLSTYAITDNLKHKAELYQKYLSITDPVYLHWALEKMLCWDQTEYAEDLIHIHGTADPVFPFRYIKDCIPVKGGTHAMIISRCKWFSKNLPKIIES